MAAESLLNYRKPGFPVYDTTNRSYRTTIEYVGPYATLDLEEPAVDETWGDYPGTVRTKRLEPMEGTNKGTLVVVCEYFFEADTGTAGTAQEVDYEVEWVMFQRSYYEHPQFAIGQGGSSELTAEDVADIKAWEQEPDPALRGAYQIDVTRLNSTTDGPVKDLSTAAKLFARGIELGQEYWEDYLPVIRKTTRYTGGNPGDSEAGAKDASTPSFPGKPSGYEWRKTADSGLKKDGQTRWDRSEEWTGAEKVLADKDTIYWSAPT